MNKLEHFFVSLVRRLYHLFDDEQCILYFDEHHHLLEVRYCSNRIERYLVIRQDRMIRDIGYCTTKRIMKLSKEERKLFLKIND